LALQHGAGSRLVDCYTMLGQCQMEKNDPEGAIAHYQSALAEPAINDESRKALSFEIGAALEALARGAEALAAYTAVYDRDPGFRDVTARKERLELEITGGSKAVGRAAQPLVKKGASNGAPAAGSS